MSNIKYCPMCQKPVSVDVEVCECGYEFSKVSEPEKNVFEELDSYDPTVIKSIAPTQPKWIATLALVLSIFGIVPGLVFAIIGLNKLTDGGSRAKCIISIVLQIVWIVLNIVIGVVFAEELAGFYY